jgi:hypothetical protein
MAGFAETAGMDTLRTLNWKSIQQHLTLLIKGNRV